MSPWLESLLGMAAFRRHIRPIEQDVPDTNLYQATKKAWNLQTSIDGELHPLQDGQGLLIVSNHPRGLLDMFMVGGWLHQTVNRPVRFVVNRLIGESFPTLDEHIIGVDNMARRGPERSAFNRAALKKAVEFLQTGGVLYVFPAGQVASWRLHSPEGWCRRTDHSWHLTFVRLAREAKVPIQTLHLSGQNRLRYRVARLFGVVFGRLMNFREFTAGVNAQTRVTVTECIDIAVIEQQNDAVISRLCRDRVFSGAEHTGSL